MSGNPDNLKKLLFIVNEQGDGSTFSRIVERLERISPEEPLKGQKLRQALRFAIECGLLRSQQGKYRLAVNICPKNLENELRQSMSRDLEPKRRENTRRQVRPKISRSQRVNKSAKIQIATGRQRNSVMIAQRGGRNKTIPKLGRSSSNANSKK